MAFLFSRNKQKVIVDLVKSAKELLVKLQTVDQLQTQVSIDYDTAERGGVRAIGLI